MSMVSRHQILVEPGRLDDFLYDRRRPISPGSVFHMAYERELVTGVSVSIAPGLTVTRQTFVNHAPPFSIALDGFVSAAPFLRKTERGPLKNIDHHAGVDRLATCSTAAQVNLALKQGLLSTFSQEGLPKVKLWIQDIDQDVCLAVSLFRLHGKSLTHDQAIRLDTLINVCDRLDRTGALCAFDPAWPKELPGQMAWIFNPYYELRISGRLRASTANDYADILEKVHQNILTYIDGKAESLAVDTGYELVQRYPSFWLVRETGVYSKNGAFTDGALALVLYRQNSDETFTYTFARASEYVDIDLPRFYRYLNSLEQIPRESTDRYGGGNTIGGSPRMSATRIEPDQMAQHLLDFNQQTTHT